MYTLLQLIEDNKIPCFIRKNAILNDESVDSSLPLTISSGNKKNNSR